jgi:DNA polymerase (family 10)
MPDKQQLSQMLADIALFLELQGENAFKMRAYQTAARIVEQLDGDLITLLQEGQLASIKGIGKTIGQHIREYLETGGITYNDELRAQVPPILFELIKIPGLGPKKAMLLYENLHINSIGELEYACRENRLLSLPGFGAKTQAMILRGIEYVKQFQGRYLLGDAWPIAEKIAEYLTRQAVVERAQVAGSIRRRKETAKDIDIVVASNRPESVMELVVGMPGVQQVVSRGLTKTSVMLTTGMHVDVRVVAPDEFMYAVHHFTGSKEHHIELRGLLKDRGLKLNEYGLENTAGERLLVADEAALYATLGLSYIAPELREGLGEISEAAVGPLPVLVTEEDIKGGLHVHTLYSDGSDSITDMVKAAQKMGWGYLGITDHSQTAVYAKGLKAEKVVAQRQEIERLNAENPEFVIFAGIESDILPDGTLDYPDEILEQFDFVIASVHSVFRQSEADMTRRIIKAIENPYVSILGHATGRILLAREGYLLDLPAIIAAAASTGTIMEINASPYRLDLDWRWCRKAREQGVLMSINPDAHAMSELEYMRYGLAIARKGWLTVDDVINTRTAAEILPILQRKRKRNK